VTSIARTTVNTTASFPALAARIASTKATS
jgi:hypothetical protein